MTKMCAMTKAFLFIVSVCVLQTCCGLNESESLLETSSSILNGQSVNVSISTSTTPKTTGNKKAPEKVRFFLMQNNAKLHLGFVGNGGVTGNQDGDYINTNDTQELFLSDPASIANSDFLPEKPVKILIHGFNGDCRDTPFPSEPLKEYLELKQEKEINVICVDWEPWSRYDGIVNLVPVYILIRTTYTVEIADRVTKLIIFLRDTKMIKSLADIHLVGLSLGAHISGTTGFKVTEVTGERVGRITGLDPAGPLYREFPDLDEQLDKSDAEFVDIYHTSMKRAGLEGKYGHADFYVNGGVRQPSCLEGRMNRQLFQSVSEVFLGGCSHNIAANYWADSIRKSDILACKAESYAQFKRIKSSEAAGCNPENQVIFGENCPISARGKYFLDLDTTYTAPTDML